LVRLAREHLAGIVKGASFAGGTDLWFAQLNQFRPELDGLDGIFYSTAATVHANDNRSVMETPSGQGDTVRSARALSAGRDVFVGPVTLRPRTWPSGKLEGYRGLPFQVDPRQPSLLAAAWTVASLKELVEAGAASLTYFETTGWRGVMERSTGSAAPELFRSRPGAIFSLYHVLADYGEWRRGGVLVPALSSRPTVVQALVTRTSTGLHVSLANLTPEPQRCCLGRYPASEVALRVLDEHTAELARDDPEAFRRHRERHVVEDSGQLQLELAPYAVVRIDPV
jgi:hypothetical protein